MVSGKWCCLNTTTQYKTSVLQATFLPSLNRFYWNEETTDSLQIRQGYHVYVKRDRLLDLHHEFGPDTSYGWRMYAWKLMLRLLGDEDNAIVLKRKQANIGADALLRESTIQAVIGNILLSSDPAVANNVSTL